MPVTAIEICDSGLNVTTPRDMRDLAQWLLTHEAEGGETSETIESATLRVYEKLRKSLSVVAGTAGFQSLASRALALARPDAPSLSAVRVTRDGSLLGFDDFKRQIDNDDDRAAEQRAGEGGIILIARLLSLLIIFLGEALTLSLLRVTWPGAALYGSNSENGRKA